MLTKEQSQKLNDAVKRERLAREDLALAYRNGDSYAVISYWILLIEELEDQLDILIEEFGETEQ